MLGRDFEDEIWSIFVFELVIWPQMLLWQDELNPRVRCAFGNVCGFSCVLPWLTLRSTVILIQENLMWNIDIYWCIYNICVFRISWSLIQSLWRFSNSLRNFAALFIVFLIGLDRNLYFAPYPPYEDDLKKLPFSPRSSPDSCKNRKLFSWLLYMSRLPKIWNICFFFCKN